MTLENVSSISFPGECGKTRALGNEVDVSFNSVTKFIHLPQAVSSFFFVCVCFVFITTLTKLHIYLLTLTVTYVLFYRFLFSSEVNVTRNKKDTI